MTVLACSASNKLATSISSICQACGLEVILIKNGRELPEIIDSHAINVLMFDTRLHDPCIIDMIYLLAQLKCEIPIIIIGDCDEKIFLSIKRIGALKELSIFTIHINAFNNAELLKVIHVIDKKNLIINDEIITSALEKKQYKLFYQPKITAATNKLAGVEALIRWERPNHGIVPPDLFIPIAESSGLIIPMTYWIISEAFSQYAAWCKKNIRLKIAINLSAKILTDSNLPTELCRLVTDFKVNPHDICFEITETTAMNSPDVALERLTRIRLKGFFLSIDDFGTGYSSLVELQRLPFTELKIDKSFVSDLTYNKANGHIVRSIINLGKNMDLSLVAEGVETKEAVDQLRELGCDNLQGYFISQPLSNEDFIKWYSVNIDKNGVFVY